MPSEDWIAEDVEAHRSAAGDLVRFVFSRSGERREVVLRAEDLPALLGAVQRKIEPGQGLPIDRASLLAGGALGVSGFRTDALPNGRVRLELYATLTGQGGRQVTISFELSSIETADMIGMLAGALKRSLGQNP